MRYSDSELFGVSKELWNKWLDDKSTPRVFFEFCISRLKDLIENSVDDTDWMSAEKNHLRTYRQKAIIFYEEKIGK